MAATIPLAASTLQEQAAAIVEADTARAAATSAYDGGRAA